MHVYTHMYTHLYIRRHSTYMLIEILLRVQYNILQQNTQNTQTKYACPGYHFSTKEYKKKTNKRTQNNNNDKTCICVYMHNVPCALARRSLFEKWCVELKIFSPIWPPPQTLKVFGWFFIAVYSCLHSHFHLHVHMYMHLVSCMC